MTFVELAARTSFSFLRGGSSPKAVVERAAALGYDAIGIADCDGLYGMVRALEAAEECKLRLVVGCEVAIDDSPLSHVWLHVESHAGYANLCEILTVSHARHPKGEPRSNDPGVPRNQFAGLPLDVVCSKAGGLWCMTVPADEKSVESLREAFGARLSLAAWKHADGEDAARLERVRTVARTLDVPVCATNRVLFARRQDKRVHDILYCIREGVTLDEAGRALLPNAEAHLKRRAVMERLFADQPAWLARSRDVADACTFSMRELRYRFPCELENPSVPGETPDGALRRLTYDGARRRWPEGGANASVTAQIEKELAVIARMNVAAYFLSVRAIVDIARDADILYQGRGSAANSAVCYCLGITAVNPAESNLLFERFLSEERAEPPDIDVDFEHERREEVIQAIYAKYGRDRAAMVSEVISYRGKSALREVGKAFGMQVDQIDRLSSLSMTPGSDPGTVKRWDERFEGYSPGTLDEYGVDTSDARLPMVLSMAQAIQGFPRHLSIHVGGFVLSAEPLTRVAPVEPATMKDRTIIPWDKDDLDVLRFFKLDVLGLGMLTAIRKTFQLAAPAAHENFSDRLAAIPRDDPRVYTALCAADAVGVFQVESRAQMSMLPRLRPREFYDLVVEVAIVRPGPIQGGMVHPYLRRRDGKEPRTPPHPSLAPILDRTFGVPLFQEQVMQIAIVGADYTGGEADQLRRDMAAWKRNGKLERHRERLLTGFEKNGIEREFAERLYKSIQGFGEYGFPESHAASFALLVYASSWLKVYYPAAFAAALVNSQPMGFYSPGSILQDAERHGVDVLPVRVDASDWDCTLEGPDATVDGEGPAIRVGLRLIKGLGEGAGERIEKARRQRPFASVEDMTARAVLDKREVEALARAGALVGFGLGRREAMWKVRAPREASLFAGVEHGDELPELPPMSRSRQLMLDYQSTGVAVGDHAMRVARPRLPPHYKNARELMTADNGARVSTAGLVICRQRPGTASGVVFVTMEDETGFVNLVLWARTFAKFRRVATTSSMLIAHGKVERQGEVVYVVPDLLEPLPMDDVPAMSRDFH